MQPFKATQSLLKEDLIPLDTDHFLSLQRKNLLIWSEIQQLLMERTHIATQIQAGLMSELLEGQFKIMFELMSEDSPEKTIEKQSELMVSLNNKTVKNIRRLGENLSASTQEISEIINRNFTSSLDDVKHIIEHAHDNSLVKKVA